MTRVSLRVKSDGREDIRSRFAAVVVVVVVVRLHSTDAKGFVDLARNGLEGLSAGAAGSG